ncbi:MAG: DUF1800 domain-containing protein, partial [Bacteroidales bacterium]|nr:DUF1800 domain-containing protein [Bacteroidales bacterium]
MATLKPLSGTLGEKNAAHLLRRATFAPTVQSIKTFSGYTVTEAMNVLFAAVTPPDPPVDLKTGTTWLNPKANETNSENGTLENYFMIWFLEQMRNSGTSIVERMVWFLHSHLPARRSVIRSSEAIYYQNKLFRHYATGDFKTLFKKTCIDNAMLIYLDGATNVVGNYNENFAREMFELYSIGKGPQLGDGDYTNYTENDIREASKILTGFQKDADFTNLDTDTSIPIGVANPDLHDETTKTFSSKFGGTTIGGTTATAENMMTELDELITMIFDQDETARFITRKLYRQFVYHDISTDVETNIITPLAANFKTANYDLSVVMKELLSSEHFYDADNAVTSDDNIGALIKSPIDLMLGTLNFFNVELPDPSTELQKLYENAYEESLLKYTFDQGLSLFEPYEVAGYPAYHQFPGYNRNWITPITLAQRYHFSNFVIKGLNGGTEQAFKADVLAWVEDTNNVSDPTDATVIVTALTSHFLAVELNTERFNFFLNDIFLDTLSALDWTSEWNTYKGGGDDTAVSGKLETLVIAMMQT